MPEFLEHSQLEEAFRRLARELARMDVVGDIYIFGGAAMVIAYRAREATRDVDALFEPRDSLHRAAITVAEEMNLPRWWLNDQATSYLPRIHDSQARVMFDHPNLRVSAISAEHLLAMKALAARAYADLDDIATLSKLLGLSDVEQVAALCAMVYPDEPLSPRARLVIEDVLHRMELDQERDRGRGRGPDGPGL